MKIGIAADHGGFEMKSYLVSELKSQGFSLEDFGAKELNNADDYPDFVLPLGQAIARGEIEKGIAICGSGVGACIALNKIKGVRAALINDLFSAHQGVEDDNMNLICLGGRTIGNLVAKELVDIFLKAKFTHEERHLRRLKKVEAMEKLNR